MSYIDREKLKRDLIDNRSFYPAIVKRALENAPTEDVVPRGEVEKAKQEVAREILNVFASFRALSPNFCKVFEEKLKEYGL